MVARCTVGGIKMKTLKTLLSVVLMMVGGLVAFYCGIGSLFILGSKDPKAQPMGYVFVGLAFLGIALAIIGLIFLARLTKGARPTTPEA
jgi:divalent metal cation (Fe/Co/Zn/Cd) transporter